MKKIYEIGRENLSGQNICDIEIWGGKMLVIEVVLQI